MKSILIIEDDEDCREIMDMILGREGYEVLQACDGAEGLAIALSQEPDLILLDMMMPIMDGWEFLAQARLDPKLDRIPIVILSGEARLDDAVAESHAAGFLKKPVYLEQLVDCVRLHLESDRIRTRA